MTTKALVMLSAAIEFATGIALIAAPGFVVRLLLGANPSGTGIAIARVAGLGLLSLGLACWPGSNDVLPHATRALFTYNLLAALYLGYLRVGGGFVSYLLWPACILHALLTLLLAVQHRREARTEYLGSTSRLS
ncbi:MAG: hypothetical protein WA655_16845 [Candidatus Korobacteraceae bacterium]